jgi:hypothetical protein
MYCVSFSSNKIFTGKGLFVIFGFYDGEREIKDRQIPVGNPLV